MTDLINKIDGLVKDRTDYIQKLVTKYSSALEETKFKKDIPYLAYIINVCVLYINKLHKDLPKDWKAWSVVVIKNLYLKDKIKKEKDIIIIIDEFIKFYTDEYKNYCEDIISATEYDRDYGFIFKFENKKIGNK